MILTKSRALLLFVSCLAGSFLVLCFYNAGFFNQSGPVYLINADERDLKAAFFNDAPHLFYCHEHGNPVRSVFYVYALPAAVL